MIEQSEKQFSTNTYKSSVPVVVKTDRTKVKKKHNIMNMFMMACCIPMLIGGAIIFFSIPAELGLGARLYALAPIAGCLAMHLVIHRLMGKSCDHKTEQKDT